MLNRGSEDLFLYDLSGSTLGLRAVFPPRYEFVEREPLDTSTALGDLPLGMALVDDALTVNDDALVYVVNELPRNTMGKVQKNILRDTFKDLFAKT